VSNTVTKIQRAEKNVFFFCKIEQTELVILIILFTLLHRNQWRENKVYFKVDSLVTIEIK